MSGPHECTEDDICWNFIFCDIESERARLNAHPEEKKRRATVQKAATAQRQQAKKKQAAAAKLAKTEKRRAAAPCSTLSNLTVSPC
jgi:hypothetical protein